MFARMKFAVINLKYLFLAFLRVFISKQEFQGQKSWKHDFEITSDPKGPPSGPTFWWGFEAPI